jgi:hypothetical protein
VESIFGTSWDELESADVERFLKTAERESILWEAKGGRTQPRPGTIHKQVCGFANALGGYLILGADKQEDGWDLGGVAFEDAEPERWISDCVGALRSPPRYDVKLWSARNGGLAVIQVEPVVVPPCMTPSGVVYERVAGETRPVTEPLVLLDLTTRGRESRGRARQLAVEHACSLVKTPPERREGVPPAFALALTAVGPPPDITVRPFSRSFFHRLEEWPLPRLPIFDYVKPHHLGPRHSQAGSWVTVDGRDASWTVFAHRDGTVAITYATDPDLAALSDWLRAGTGPVSDDGIRAGEGPLAAAWRLAADLLHELDCRGEARFCTFANREHPALKGAPEDVVVERPTDVRPPSSAEFDSVVRELNRSTGSVEFEPKRDAAGA